MRAGVTLQQFSGHFTRGSRSHMSLTPARVQYALPITATICARMRRSILPRPRLRKYLASQSKPFTWKDAIQKGRDGSRQVPLEIFAEASKFKFNPKLPPRIFEPQAPRTEVVPCLGIQV